MGAHQSCKLYHLTGEYDNQHTPIFARRPLRVWLGARPVLLRYDQMEVSNYFRREGANEYRQLTNAQVERILYWVTLHKVNPLELTTTQVDAILSAPAGVVT